jgi:chaperone modulatory protein CbpM
MTQEDALIGALLDESWLTLEQLAAACVADVEWLQQRLDAGLLPQAQSLGGVWRFSSATLRRARLLRQIERDFDAVPELAGLVGDLIEEIERLRTRLALRGLT